MLRVIAGRFHPSLETALIEQVRRAKAADPFAPLLVLVPSAPLLARVRKILTLDGQALLNIHFLTFHQLVLRLADERRLRLGRPPLRVVDEVFFQQLIKQIVKSRLSNLAPLQQIGQSSGMWGALWSTIRDLKDAGVDPAVAVRGLAEGCFEQEDLAWLTALFSVHAAVRDVGQTLQAGTADDLAESLIAEVPYSPFLSTLQQAFYYGFYDLTQVQLSLFEAVSSSIPTTLFFPLERGKAWGFAQRFFDRCIQPRAAHPDMITRLPEPAAEARITVTVHSVIGAEEELAAICRTIIDLVETNGYQFDDIGVVARTLDPYRTLLSGVFDRYHVPFSTTAGRPLMHEPLCKVLLQLVTLPSNDFYRTPVLDVVTSPLYAPDHLDHRHQGYRPEQWKLAVPGLQITRGAEEWRRLERAARVTLNPADGDEQDKMLDELDIAPEVIALLWQTVSRLLIDCLALPQQGTAGQLIAACRDLARRHLAGSGEMDVAGSDPLDTRLRTTWTAIDGVWARLEELDLLGEEMSWAEFVELLTQTCERTTIPLEEAAHRGVTVVDAMAARGLTFKAVCVLGLNEKLFPRYIREDAFLRDRHRRVLDATLGFKIDEKLGGYEEEALLFELLVQGAVHRLYLSYQRADEAGRVLAVSPFLGDVNKRFGLDGRSVEEVPRRLTDRLAQRPVLQRLLPPAELAQWMAMSGQDAAALIEAVGRESAVFRHALNALAGIEDDASLLNGYDGLTGPLDAHWSAVQERGVAPTPLERYARCPFQYFAADVLRLEPVRWTVAQEPDAALLGTLCHAALKCCYEQLLAIEWPAKPVGDDTIRAYIQSAVNRASQDCEARHRTGYYLLWELAKEQVMSLIAAAVTADAESYREEPYAPVSFEVDAAGSVTDVLPDGSTALKIRGRVDRIDRHRDTGAVRIVDYKFKTGSAIKPEDRNLPQSALRGYRLQPPLYARLLMPGLPPTSQVQFIFLAPQWEPPVARSMFDVAALSGEPDRRIQQTLRLLIGGLQTGRFFILPDTYCDHCEFRVICRREHQPSWWRSYRAEEVKSLKSLRLQRLSEELRGTDS
ncbi:MAG: exodeoxyribonuclease V subunit gamma [Nitrospira sp.]|nr:exodeoxyribonuclease V subunit gamma [Nitrospira sp.]